MNRCGLRPFDRPLLRRPPADVTSCFSADATVRKSDLRVCDDATCRFGSVCRDDGAQLKCVCQFQVGNEPRNQSGLMSH